MTNNVNGTMFQRISDLTDENIRLRKALMESCVDAARDASYAKWMLVRNSYTGKNVEEALYAMYLKENGVELEI